MPVLVAYSDGAARGNPGQAGVGVVFYNEAGQELHTISRYLGTATNNQAEYKALLLALEYAVKEQSEKLQLYSDSELIVKQLKGEYRVKDKQLKELFLTARALIAKINNFSIEHLPREKNKRADQLANLAIDQAKGTSG